MNNMTYVYKPATGGPPDMLWDSANTRWIPANSFTPSEPLDGVYSFPILVPAKDLDQMTQMLREMGFPLGELAAPDDLVKEFEAAVARSLDAFAREKQYDNMDKARLASLTVDFRTDGDYANQLYDKVWGAAFALEDQIRAGALTVGDALAQLPAMTWPTA